MSGQSFKRWGILQVRDKVKARMGRVRWEDKSWENLARSREGPYRQ